MKRFISHAGKWTALLGICTCPCLQMYTGIR